MCDVLKNEQTYHYDLFDFLSILIIDTLNNYNKNQGIILDSSYTNLQIVTYLIFSCDLVLLL